MRRHSQRSTSRGRAKTGNERERIVRSNTRATGECDHRLVTVIYANCFMWLGFHSRDGVQQEQCLYFGTTSAVYSGAQC